MTVEEENLAYPLALEHTNLNNVQIKEKIR